MSGNDENSVFFFKISYWRKSVLQGIDVYIDTRVVLMSKPAQTRQGLRAQHNADLRKQRSASSVPTGIKLSWRKMP